jgi:hypothetical protein
VSPAAVVAVPRMPATEQLQWLAPAPLWNGLPAGPAGLGLTQPWIAELRSDAFISDFLGLVGGQDGASPAGLAGTIPHRTVGGVPGAPFRLFQPLSQCYYIVTASLVCRRPGIPDHAVQRAQGERTSFVLRLIGADGTEQAWVPAGHYGSSTAPAPGAPPTGSWQPAAAGALAPGEEKFPMHPAPVAPFADRGSTAGTLGMAAGTSSTRQVCYGYLPVGRRERMVPAIPDPVAALAAMPLPFGISLVNPWLDELMARVINPWAALADPAPSFPGGAPASFPGYPSLYLLLDLADWLGTYLPQVHQAITAGTAVTGAAGDLLILLQNTTVRQGSGRVALAAAIASLAEYQPLVTGEDVPDAPPPPQDYDLSSDQYPQGPGGQSRVNWFAIAKSVDSAIAATTGPSALPATSPGAAGLADYALAALAEAAADPGYTAPAVPPELAGLIKNDPVSPPAGATEPTYVVRAVFEHDPCQPVLSDRSPEFVLARAVDADAPARQIRIQLPDITNLRQSKRGVALEMSPGLSRIISQVTPGILRGGGLSGGSPQLGMICSFSLQIIFLCAFIVLFVFLMLLNIVFWWLPFLKICFPVPAPPPAQKWPSP